MRWFRYALLVVGPSAVQAQAAAKASGGRWEFLLALGQSQSRVASPLAEALAGAGLADDRVSPGPDPARGLVLSVDTYPVTDVRGRPTFVAVSYRAWSHVSVRVQASSVRLGDVDAFHGVDNERVGSAARTIGMDVALRHAARSIAAIPVVSFGGLVELGAGPAVFAVTQERQLTASDMPAELRADLGLKATRFTPAAVLHAALTTSSHRGSVFFEGAIQYHVMRVTDLGALDVIDSQTTASVARMAHTPVDARHWSVTLGVGIRPR